MSGEVLLLGAAAGASKRSSCRVLLEGDVTSFASPPGLWLGEDRPSMSTSASLPGTACTVLLFRMAMRQFLDL